MGGAEAASLPLVALAAGSASALLIAWPLALGIDRGTTRPGEPVPWDAKIVAELRRRPAILGSALLAIVAGVMAIHRPVSQAPLMRMVRLGVGLPSDLDAREVDRRVRLIASQVASMAGVEAVDLPESARPLLPAGRRAIDILLKEPISGVAALQWIQALEQKVLADLPVGVELAASPLGLGRTPWPGWRAIAPFPRVGAPEALEDLPAPGDLLTDPATRGRDDEVLLEPGPAGPGGIRLNTSRAGRTVLAGDRTIRVVTGETGESSINEELELSFGGPSQGAHPKEVALHPRRTPALILRENGVRIAETTRALLSAAPTVWRPLVDQPIFWEIGLALLLSLFALPSPRAALVALAAPVAGAALALLAVPVSDVPLVLAALLPGAALVVAGSRRAAIFAIAAGLLSWIPQLIADGSGAWSGMAITAIAGAVTLWGIGAIEPASIAGRSE
jgi:hypothetical protein